MQNQVDPRFARWFGRQVVLHARAEADVFVQKVRKHELERWTKAKTTVSNFFLVLMPFTFGQLASLYFTVTVFCTNIFLILVFVFLPLLLLAPFAALTCHYRNSSSDVCSAIDLNYSLPFHPDGYNHYMMIDAKLVYQFGEGMRLFADIFDFSVFVMQQFRLLSHVPDMSKICEILDKYHIYL